MSHPIKNDHGRFKKIVKGKIRKNLKNFVSEGVIPHSKNGKTFNIPMPQIELPKFRFGKLDQGGIGQGSGQKGDAIKGEEQENQKAGSDAGDKEIEVEVSLEDLALILTEELELPNIEPKQNKRLLEQSTRYNTIGSTGPDSLKHFKRSYKEAIKRQVSLNEYDPQKPTVIPIKKDMRYRSFKTAPEESHNAVIIYMMDVSGSMGDEQKQIIRTESFWINLWLKYQYKDISVRYIIHDATAKEVDEHTFFRTRESGGTLISSAFSLCKEIIQLDYPQEDWNIYPFHFSDGDNWSVDDTKLCLNILKNDILPVSNMFCYGQVESRYGSGQFYKDLSKEYGENSETIILSKIKNRDEILPSIKKFFGKKK